ncbi:MAG: carboxypeptidase regulatory-like domain-containing protein [Anaerolineae bacterium]
MCRDVVDRLPEWAAGRLSPAAKAGVDAHLAVCAACRAEAALWCAGCAAAHEHVAERSAAVALPPWRDPAPRRAAAPIAPALRSDHAIGAPTTTGFIAALSRRRTWTALALLGVAAAAALFIVDGNADPAVVRGPQAGTPAGASGLPAIGSPSIAPLPGAAPPSGARAPTAVLRRDRPTPPRVRPEGGGGASSLLAGLPVGVVRAEGDVGPSVQATATAASAPRRVERASGHRDAPSPLPPAAPMTPAAPDLPPTPGAPTPAEPTAAPSSPPSPPTATAGPPVAIVAGTVTGPDGLPRAEVRIVARPMDDALATVEGGTNGEGAYTLTLPPGRWSVHAEAGAYLAAWPDGGVTPMDGPATDAVAGETTRVDFALRAAPGGAIRGRVIDREGWPVPGALVVAAEPDRERGGYTRFVAATFTADDGTYGLAVMSGGWLVAATADWRASDLVWWGGGDLITVERLTGSRRAAAEGIDFRLR